MRRYYLKLEYDKNDILVKSIRYEKYRDINMNITHPDGVSCTIEKHLNKGWSIIEVKFK